MDCHEIHSRCLVLPWLRPFVAPVGLARGCTALTRLSLCWRTLLSMHYEPVEAFSSYTPSEKLSDESSGIHFVLMDACSLTHSPHLSPHQAAGSKLSAKVTLWTAHIRPPYLYFLSVWPVWWLLDGKLLHPAPASQVPSESGILLSNRKKNTLLYINTKLIQASDQRNYKMHIFNLLRDSNQQPSGYCAAVPSLYLEIFTQTVKFRDFNKSNFKFSVWWERYCKELKRTRREESRHFNPEVSNKSY